jgi:uncharacterized alkaline shock family protein YloU
VSEYHRPAGKTTVSTEVLVAIARMAAVSVPGVQGVAIVPGGVDRLFRRRLGEGVRMIIQDGLICGDIYLVMKGGVNVQEVGRDVQRQVARAIQEMVGMDVGRIDIHVESIEYEQAEA